jgi:predicted short-subunit dehydrogenase-like oxidoreductase (DUF2520 family)
LTVVAVASRSPTRAKQLAARIPACAALDPQQAADLAGLVFITTPDDAIAGVASGLRWRAGQCVVHCSGATEVTALAPAAASGAFIGGFHPMQAFADPDAALASLPGCTISIEAQDSRLAATLEMLAARMQCRSIRLPPGCRVRYHASGGYASQFVNVLLREATDIWKTFGVAEEDAVRALLPLLKGTIAAIENAGVAGGMPGPVSRGDAGTTVTLAVEKGSVSAEKAEELRKILAPGK